MKRSHVILHCLWIAAFLIWAYWYAEGRHDRSESQLRSETFQEPPLLQLKTRHKINLGKFEISEARIVVSDPSYDLSTAKIPGLGAILDNCRTGSWRGFSVTKEFLPDLVEFGAELWAWHQSITNEAQLSWVKQEKEIGADTGQIGIFDLKHYQDDKVVPINHKWTLGPNGTPIANNELWYSFCCEMTDTKKFANVMPFGVVSRSGHGDGGYYYFVARDQDGTIIGVKVVFIDDQGRG